MIHGPQMMDWRPTVGVDDDCSLSAHVVDKKLEKGVDGKRLVDVSDRVHEGGGL